MKIIPAIDIIKGACVRLEKGDYSKQKTYNSDPVAVAKSFEEVGVKHLHVVDLDGAKAQQVVNLETLSAICSATHLSIDFGGGVKTRDQVDLVLAAGASQVTGGSIAAKNKAEFKDWIDVYGTEKLILGADVFDHQIMVSGWQEASSLHIYDFLEYYDELGIRYVICTDISKDGMLAGPAFDLYEDLMRRFPSMQFIASGGVSCADDVKRLESAGLYATIIGKAIYEGNITMDELAELC
jgi:phosphoribosylformimino-5-aminoimidazole carboxamide ribotide isomerase